MSGQGLLDHGRFLEVLGIEAELLAGAAHATAPETPVPTCPGWAVHELIRHVGSVYRAVLGWLADGRRPREWQRDPLLGQSVHDYFRAGFTDLVAELERHDAADRAATWWPADPTYGFWSRRTAHETTIHRVDVQMASAVTVSTVAEDVAIDGVDEVLALWFGQRLPMLGLTGTRQWSVAVRTGGQTWIARASPTETVAWRCSADEARQADVTVSGTPVDVYLWLWGRARPGTVDVRGADDDASGQLWALLRLATR